jgi:hypothetical protein
VKSEIMLAVDFFLNFDFTKIYRRRTGKVKISQNKITINKKLIPIQHILSVN